MVISAESRVDELKVRADLDKIALGKFMLEDDGSMTVPMLMEMNAEQINTYLIDSASLMAQKVFDIVQKYKKQNNRQSGREKNGGVDESLLVQRIGNPPDRCWKDDIVPAAREGLKNMGYNDTGIKWTESYEKWLSSRTDSIKVAEGIGWSNAEAIMTEALYNQYSANAIGKAIAEKSPRYAALTHAAYNALASKANEGHIAPKCYRSLLNLSRRDSGWNTVLEKKSFTAFGPTVATLVDEKHYAPEGMKVWQGGKYVVEESDVVCFISSIPDSSGLHSGVKVGPKDYMFPPLSSFRVVEVKPKFEMLPGKVVNRKLIVVTPTYHLPIDATKSTRIKFMEVLEDVIGPQPDRPWHDDVIHAVREGIVNNGYSVEKVKWAESYEAWLKSQANSIKVAEDSGWTHEEAILTEACYNQYSANAIGKAIAENSPRYAALTHAAYNVLAKKAKDGHVAPKCYRSLLNLSRRYAEHAF
jgi:hypothetical protein